MNQGVQAGVHYLTCESVGVQQFFGVRVAKIKKIEEEVRNAHDAR